MNKGNAGELRVKRINELIEGFSGLNNTVPAGDEDKYWQVFDFKRNQKFMLPMGTAINFFREFCESIKEEGFTDDNGEALYYFGECLGNTRPLRIRFEASLHPESGDDDDEEEEGGVDEIDFINKIYKTLISCLVMALMKKFEKTSHGKEYRVCGVMYSTDQNTEQLDVTIYFPYARMKDTDFKNVFIPTFCSIIDNDIGENLYRKMIGVRSVSDIISQDTFSDTIPLFGCVSSSDEYPKNKVEYWYVNEVPRSVDEIMDADIGSSGEDDLVMPSEHFVFDKEFATKPKTISQQSFWKPLIFTNSFWKQRLVAINLGESDYKTSSSSSSGSTLPSFNSKKSPYIQRVNNAVKGRADYSQMSKESADKRIITDVMQHIMETDDYQSIPFAKKNAVVKFIKYGMHMQEIQGLIEVFKIKEDWFKVEVRNSFPPIQVGNDGFYLEFDKLPFVLDHLSPKRAEVTKHLEDIACIIYTMARTYDEKEEARHLFIEFVRSNPVAFKQRGLEAGVSEIFTKQIKRAAKRRITFWTLLSMFEEDDPLYYNVWWQYICDYYILHSLDSDMASFPVARAAALPLIGKYAHTTGDARQTWWKYTGTYWRNAFATQGIELELTTNFIRSVQCTESRYSQMIDSFQTKKITFKLLRDRIHEAAFRTGIVKDMANVLLRDNRLLTFSAGNDPEYADLWASINYVYEFTDGEMRRRKGRWEDFLTKCFDVIDECLPLTDPRCQFILSWVHKMLRDPATEHEFLKDLGSWVRGFNRDKRFDVWYGYGNGGKSKFMDVVCSTLGLCDGYAFKLPLESMLEGAKKSVGAADPSIEQGRNAFLAVLDEPKKGMKFDAGKIKANTGNDPTYNRGLFSKGGTFRPMYKTVLLGNVLPKADYDMAMKIRFWVWHFKGRFAEPEECPSTPEEQERLGIYPLDKDLDNKIPEYKPAMLSILLHYYKLYHKEGVKRTPGIKKATDMFWNSANDVLCFMSEQTVVVDNLDTYVQTDELYDAFRRWFMSRNNGDRVMTKILFIEELQAIYTNQDLKAQGGLAGIRLRDGN